MVDSEGQVKLIDFGSAMKEDARRLTFAGSSPILGTPEYISPEQVKGHRGDQRSDIYAVGAMLYEMLTGRPPFTGSNPLAIMNERLLTDATPARQLNPEISPQLQEILFRALERDPHNRYATSGEMAGNWNTGTRFYRGSHAPASFEKAGSVLAGARYCSMRGWRWCRFFSLA